MIQIGGMKLYDVPELAELLQVHEKTARALPVGLELLHTQAGRTAHYG